jgi:hypothetical protein
MGLPQNATTVRVEGGKTLTTDGPFVGMKEAVGGRSWIDEMLDRPPGSGVRHLR